MYENALTNLNKVIEDLSNKYECEENDIGLVFEANGILALSIKGKPLAWFFNELDLLNWLDTYENVDTIERKLLDG